MISNKFFLDQMMDLAETLTSSVFDGSQVCNELLFKNIDIAIAGKNIHEMSGDKDIIAERDSVLQNEQVKNLRLSSRIASLEGKLVDAKNDSIKMKMEAISFETEIKELDRKLRHNKVEQAVQAKLRQQLHAREIEVAELKAENVLLRKQVSASEKRHVPKDRDMAAVLMKKLITKEQGSRAAMAEAEKVEAKQNSAETAKQETAKMTKKYSTKAEKKSSIVGAVDAKVHEGTKKTSEKATTTMRKLDKAQDIAMNPVPIHKEDFARLKNVTRLTVQKEKN